MVFTALKRNDSFPPFATYNNRGRRKDGAGCGGGGACERAAVEECE